jgi:RNA polymerase sigma factor (sigma-70 family)
VKSTVRGTDGEFFTPSVHKTERKRGKAAVFLTAVSAGREIAPLAREVFDIVASAALLEFDGFQTPMPDDHADPSERAHIDPESTFSLIERARAGDEQALERLFARHLRPLQRWATGRLPRWARDLADTDDLVQDTLLKTFKRIESFEPRRVGALQAYLRNAVLNRLRDELRRKGREPESTNLDSVDVEAADSPLETAIGREGVKEYEKALERVKPEEREAIIARVELGYSYQELAVMLDKPTADAARKTAQRALVRLAEEMKRAREQTDA